MVVQFLQQNITEHILLGPELIFDGDEMIGHLYCQDSTLDVHARVYRWRGERYHDACVVENDRFGGGSVMIWGGISLQHKMEVRVIDGNLNAQRCQAEVLAPAVIPFILMHPQMLLMQDNATSESARATIHCLATSNVQVMDWPTGSTDLNPVEHIWKSLDRRLGHHFFIFCFTDFFRNKLVSEDEIKMKIKFIRTIFQLH